MPFRNIHRNEEYLDRKANYDKLKLQDDLNYSNLAKKKRDEKGSRSARRVCAKSTSEDRSSNRNEFSSLKCGGSGRTIKSYREKQNEKESYNDSFEPRALTNKSKAPPEAKIRYEYLDVSKFKAEGGNNIKDMIKNMNKSKDEHDAVISPELK